jgi:hypothetical protein
MNQSAFTAIVLTLKPVSSFEKMNLLHDVSDLRDQVRIMVTGPSRNSFLRRTENRNNRKAF